MSYRQGWIMVNRLQTGRREKDIKVKIRVLLEVTQSEVTRNLLRSHYVITLATKQ